MSTEVLQKLPETQKKMVEAVVASKSKLTQAQAQGINEDEAREVAQMYGIDFNPFMQFLRDHGTEIANFLLTILKVKT